MAEDENAEASVADALADGETGGGKGILLRLLVPVGVVVFAAGAGYLTLRLTGTQTSPTPAAAGQQPSTDGEESPAFAKGQGGKDEYIYYDLQPIIVNLNEPRLARYIRATLTLVIRKEDHETAAKTIEEKLPALRGWLILYLSDCSLEEVRGAGNLNRILRDIQDSLNDRLWPNGRPLIARVEYKEWAVQ